LVANEWLNDPKNFGYFQSALHPVENHSVISFL
jgi:hypothetical protein